MEQMRGMGKAAGGGRFADTPPAATEASTSAASASTGAVPVSFVGVPEQEWGRIGEELAAQARWDRRAEREEATCSAAVLADVQAALAEAAQEAADSTGHDSPSHDGPGHDSLGRGWRSAGQELEAGLSTAARGIGQASLTRAESTRLLESDLATGLDRLGAQVLATEAVLTTLALQAHARGLPAQGGSTLTDWLTARCPWLSRSQLGDIDALARAGTHRLNTPLIDAATQGRTPARRGAIVARALAKLSPVLDPDGYEAFVTIFTDAACTPTITDAGLREIIETAVKALLDEAEKTRREKIAHEARSLTSRRLGTVTRPKTLD